MIGIEVKGTFLELGNESVRFEKINASFITDLFQGDFSFPITLSDTEINLKTLGFTNVIELVNRTVELSCYVWLFGVPYTQAKLVVSAGSHRTIVINIAGGVKSMRIADKSLKEINYGDDYLLGMDGDTDSIIATAKAISLTTLYSDYGFTFVPHKNEGFYGSNNTDFCGIINRQDSTNGNFLKNNVSIGNVYAIVPFLYMFFVLSKIFEEEGLQPEGEFWDDEEMQKLLLYNNYALDSPNNDDNCYVITGSEVSYTTNTRLKLFKGPPTTFDPAGAWSNSLYEYTIQQAGDIIIDVFINAYVDTRATDHFGTYEPHFNLYIDGVFSGQLVFPSQSYGNFSRSLSYTYTATVGDIGKKIYLSNYIAPVFLPLTGLIFTVHSDSYMLVTNSSESINLYSGRVTFKNHVKDITVSEFLAELKNIGISLDFDYNNAKIKLSYDKNHTKEGAAYDDWTDKCTGEYEINFEEQNKGFVVNYDFGSTDQMVEGNFTKYLSENYKGEYTRNIDLPSPSKLGSVALVSNTNQLYIVAQNPSGPGYVWTYFSDNYYDIVLGRGESQAKSRIAPMFMCYSGNEGGTPTQNACVIPISNQSGSSQMFGQGVNDFDLRFVFLRGVNQTNDLPTPQGGSYIYAGTSVYGINGDLVGNYEFKLNSKKGIIDIFILNFLKALTAADIIERDIRLNELDVLTLDVKKKKVISGVSFWVKSASIYVSDVLKATRVRMLKL